MESAYSASEPSKRLTLPRSYHLSLWPTASASLTSLSAASPSPESPSPTCLITHNVLDVLATLKASSSSPLTSTHQAFIKLSFTHFVKLVVEIAELSKVRHEVLPARQHTGSTGDGDFSDSTLSSSCRAVARPCIPVDGGRPGRSSEALDSAKRLVRHTLRVVKEAQDIVKSCMVPATFPKTPAEPVYMATRSRIKTIISQCTSHFPNTHCAHSCTCILS